MSNASTIRYSSAAGVDWAALIAGLGLGLTVAMQVTTITNSDISTPYALITSFSRLCALVGTYFAVLGISLIARTILFRLLRAFIHLPMMLSDSPPALPSFHSEYTSAVSMKFPPAAT